MKKDAAPMSKDEYLKQFPKNVISKGEIVPIREELERRFQETGKIDTSKLNKNEPIEAPTVVALDEQNKYTADQIVTLRVRTETGQRTVLVKLLRSDKMDKVYEFVMPYVEFPNKKCELRSKFPNRAYEENDSKTLEELGLAPGSALVVQTK